MRIQIEAAYAKAGLVEVLHGGMPPKADEIIVVPMDDIAEPAAHRTRDVLAYRQALEKNRAAIQTKMRMTIECRGQIYTMVIEMLATNHPSLAEHVHDVCDMGTADFGIQYFDGVRADAIMNRLLVPPGGQTEEDKAFYKLALKTQEDNPLPDHCTKEVYLLKANTYLNYIRPNLPYVIEALDAFRHVVRLMPNLQLADKNRLEDKHETAHTYVNLQDVVEECGGIVYYLRSLLHAYPSCSSRRSILLRTF